VTGDLSAANATVAVGGSLTGTQRIPSSRRNVGLRVTAGPADAGAQTLEQSADLLRLAGTCGIPAGSAVEFRVFVADSDVVVAHSTPSFPTCTPTKTTAAPVLPVTGASAGGLFLAGLTVLGAGVGVLLMVRRRRDRWITTP
jgi:LPXTG-motif cell wall-anchored protein